MNKELKITTIAFLSATNKMQRHTIFFIIVNAVHVSSGFSAHHQELKNCTCSIRYLSKLFAATANVGESVRLIHISGSSKQVLQVFDAACTVFELLMMSEKTARNVYVVCIKVREVIAVKVLHTSMLNTTVVAFKVLPLGSYTLMPVPSPSFKTIL